MNRVFKALSDPTRRRVLELLRARPMNAGELAAEFPVAKATMSAHFAILREADLVTSEKVGREIVYRLKLSVLEEAILSFSQAFGFSVGATPPQASAHPAPNPQSKEKATAT